MGSDAAEENRPRLLFVCAGNICRSPMAEHLARNYAQRCDRTLELRSVSLLGLDGQPAHEHAIAVMQELGIDISAHRSKPVCSEAVDWAHHILAMETRHSAELRLRFPEAGSKILTLGSIGGVGEIDDPLGASLAQFRGCRDRIRRCIERFVDFLPATSAVAG